MVWSAADLRALDAIRVVPGEIVYAFVSLAGEPSSIDEALLDDEESDRSRRFVRRSDRCHFVLAHVALRLFLARCLGVDPAAVTYERGLHGKPRLGQGLGPLQFNLSHAGKLGLLAAARNRALGVDVEHVRDVGDVLEIADQHFSDQERVGLRTLPPIERQAGFFRCWTRKEAVIKACGEGLSCRLDSFDVDLAPGSPAALRRFGGRCGREAGLALRDLATPPGYVAAGAVAATASAPISWRLLSTGHGQGRARMDSAT